jgi:hypothetical protein
VKVAKLSKRENIIRRNFDRTIVGICNAANKAPTPSIIKSAIELLYIRLISFGNETIHSIGFLIGQSTI